MTLFQTIVVILLSLITLVICRKLIGVIFVVAFYIIGALIWAVFHPIEAIKEVRKAKRKGKAQYASPIVQSWIESTAEEARQRKLQE